MRFEQIRQMIDDYKRTILNEKSSCLIDSRQLEMLSVKSSTLIVLQCNLNVITQGETSLF